MVYGAAVSQPFDPSAAPHELMYTRVAKHLQQRIESGELSPGQRLTPERELAEEYGVAYHTVRRALLILREQGMIASVHGRGTFVLPRENWAGTDSD